MKRHLSVVALALALVVAATPVFAAAAANAKSTATATTAKAAPAKAAPSKSKMEAPASDAGKVDLNTATKDELMKVPGIAEATAAKIIAGRPFKAKNELVTKGIVNKAQYAKLAKYVVARQK